MTADGGLGHLAGTVTVWPLPVCCGQGPASAAWSSSVWQPVPLPHPCSQSVVHINVDSECLLYTSVLLYFVAHMAPALAVEAVERFPLAPVFL